MIRLGGPLLGEEELHAIRAVLASGQLVQAGEVAAFEAALSEYLGAPAVAVSSGTAALHLALLSMGIGPGDLVVVPAFSWPATANVVETVGAQPVFVDIDKNAFNLDPGALAATLERLCGTAETRRRLRAVIVVHAFGAIGDMAAVAALCKGYGVPLIEDAACALGSTQAGRKPGSWGEMACFSFHPRKLMTTAEGGAVVCSDPAQIARVKSLRNHGLDSLADMPDFILPGLNYRMSEVHAAIGRCQLARLEALVVQRRRQAEAYSALILPQGVLAQAVREDCRHNVQSYVVRLPVSDAGQRDKVIAKMRQRDIETTIGTWHIPLTSYYRRRYNYGVGDFSATDRVFSTALTLPLSAAITETEQQMVIAALSETLQAILGVA